jgi:hypothetical protein
LPKGFLNRLETSFSVAAALATFLPNFAIANPEHNFIPDTATVRIQRL